MVPSQGFLRSSLAHGRRTCLLPDLLNGGLALDAYPVVGRVEQLEQVVPDVVRQSHGACGYAAEADYILLDGELQVDQADSFEYVRHANLLSARIVNPKTTLHEDELTNGVLSHESVPFVLMACLDKYRRELASPAKRELWMESHALSSSTTLVAITNESLSLLLMSFTRP